jgi:SAM-dependent methyltransferase
MAEVSDELKGYLAPEFNLENADRYYVRQSILDAVTENISHLTGRLLDVGCGRMPYKSLLTKPFGHATEYIGLDFEKPVVPGYQEHVMPDMFWDGRTIPLPDGNVDSILLTEVLEHCFEPAVVLRECCRVLRNDGRILITVPFLWPLHDIPFDEYRYTPYSLKRILKESGFSKVKMKGLGGWHASLGQMVGLWLNRSGIGGWRRNLLYHLFFKHFMRWLFARDRKPDNFQDDAHMFTGLQILARK